MTSGNTMHEMPLKAVNINGQATKVPGFKIDMAKVALVTPSSPSFTAFSSDPSLMITAAKLRSDKQAIDLQRNGTGNTYSLVRIPPGVYIVDVIGQKENNQAAYENIIVIGSVLSPPIQNIIQQRIVQETRVDIDTDNPFKPNNKETKCLYDPGNSLCKPDSDGDCPSGWGTNEDGQCFPMDKDCPKGYWRADDDETGACVPKTEAQYDMSNLPACDGSSQDCVTENGDVCAAGSSEHECELDEVESTNIADESGAEDENEPDNEPDNEDESASDDDGEADPDPDEAAGDDSGDDSLQEEE